MLEEEGIKFESDGMKIKNEHFVTNNNDEETKVCAKKGKVKATKATKRHHSEKTRC